MGIELPQIPFGKAVFEVHTSHQHGLFFNGEKSVAVPETFIGAMYDYINIFLHCTYRLETAEGPDPWFEQFLVLCCPLSVPGNFLIL